MYLIKINFVDFIEIMEKEIIFHDRRFYGNDEDHRDNSKKFWIKKYYASLRYFKIKEVEIAFDRCRESYNKFPSVYQLLKFCPPKQMTKPVADKNYTGPAPIPPKIQDQMNQVYFGPSRIRLSDHLMDSMKKRCRFRWGGDWTETFKRWDLENNRRL